METPCVEYSHEGCNECVLSSFPERGWQCCDLSSVEVKLAGSPRSSPPVAFHSITTHSGKRKKGLVMIRQPQLHILAKIGIPLLGILLTFSLTRWYISEYSAVPVSPDFFLKAGDVIEEFGGLRWGSSRTLLIALSPGCEVCNTSVAFYRRLLHTRATEGWSVRVVVIFPLELREKDCNSYLESRHLVPDKVVMAPFDRIGIPATPTLALIDASGRASSVWYGLLSEDREHDLLQKLRVVP